MARRSDRPPSRPGGVTAAGAGGMARPADQAAAAAAQGLAAERAGNLQVACNWYHAAVTAYPNHVDAHRRLAAVLYRLGRAEQATGVGLKAMALDPSDGATAASLGRLLRGREINLARSDPMLDAGIAACLTHPNANPDDFRLIAEAALRVWPPISGLTGAVRRGRPPDAAWCLSDTGRQALTAPLMVAFLSRTLNTDGDIETAFVSLRRCLATAPARIWQAPHVIAFATALARQMRINEYVFVVTAEEADAARRAVEDLETCDALTADRRLPALMTAALYGPLVNLPNARLLADQADALPNPAGDFVRESVTEDLALRATAQSVASLTPLADIVSTKVQAQYEENPYPRWLEFKRPKAGGWREELTALAGTSGLASSVTAPRVLIAGCGTGRQPLSRAISYGTASDILAVDLSRQSLAYAIHQAERLDIRHVHFAQADLLELTPDAAGDFDIIEAVGVLHHLADPLAGWRVLVNLLRSGGLMRIGLYSRLGRADINRIRDDIRQQGIPAEPDAMRAYRQTLLQSTEPHVRRVLTGLSDVHSLSGCRDLLFHVQEHQFTLPEIADALAALSLELFAIERHANMREALPGPSDLDGWLAAEAANPDLFRAMYVFWCRKV